MNVGVVVIGRNEGTRLVHALNSVMGIEHPVIYVDSGSSDGSIMAARLCGADIVELDPANPFSAARARNEGFKRLLDKYPGIRFVQFLDGDCQLAPRWIEAGMRALSEHAKRAAVIGHLQERHASSSLYNRLCALEWQSPIGDLRSYGQFGGVSMIRAKVFRELGGFRADMIAGEDPELGVRIGLAGYTITKIDCPMAIHDADIVNFRQWWRRAVRAGHAFAQRCDINGASAMRDCVRERNSTFFWGLALPPAILSIAFFNRGAALLLLTGYVVLAVRIWRYRRRLGDGVKDSLLYASFVLIAKFAEAVGLVTFFLNKYKGRYELIEYK